MSHRSTVKAVEAGIGSNPKGAHKNPSEAHLSVRIDTTGEMAKRTTDVTTELLITPNK